MRNRTSLVLALISKPHSATEITQALAECGGDSEGEPATVTKRDVLAVLKQFEQGLISAAAVQTWANAVRGHSDIVFEFGAEGVVEESLYWLANSESNGPIDAYLCHRIVSYYERRGSKRTLT